MLEETLLLCDMDPELLLLIVEKLDVRHQGRVAACCKLFGLLVLEHCKTTPFLASTASDACARALSKPR